MCVCFYIKGMCYFIIQNVHTTEMRKNTWFDTHTHTHTSCDLLAGPHDIAWQRACRPLLKTKPTGSTGQLSQKSQLAGDPGSTGPHSTSRFMQITEEELLRARNTHIYTHTHAFYSTTEPIASPGTRIKPLCEPSSSALIFVLYETY